jgi:hypothetical protein
VASLVASIAGLTVLFGSLIPSVLGVIFGHIALNAAKRGEASNRGVALGGLITGYVGLAVTVIFWGFLILVVGLASLDTIGGYDSWALAPLSGLV